jgi:hypothetical protein
MFWANMHWPWYYSGIKVQLRRVWVIRLAAVWSQELNGCSLLHDHMLSDLQVRTVLL